MEGRLRESSLSPPEISLARQQALPESRLGSPERKVFGEHPILMNKNILDQIRMIQGPHPPRTEPDRHHVPEASGAVGEKRETITFELVHISADPSSLRTGGGGGSGGRRRGGGWGGDGHRSLLRHGREVVSQPLNGPLRSGRVGSWVLDLTELSRPASSNPCGGFRFPSLPITMSEARG